MDVRLMSPETVATFVLTDQTLILALGPQLQAVSQLQINLPAHWPEITEKEILGETGYGDQTSGQ
jgi:hypothetical protein